MLLKTGSLSRTEAPSYPNYNQVARKFFTRFQWQRLKNDTLDIRFARKPQGWVLQQTSFPDDQVVRTWLLWDASKRSWAEPPLPKRQEPIDARSIEQSLRHYRNRLFAVCPYYGYRGWHIDVIQQWGDQDASKLQDSLLYGVARAYATYASNLLHLNEAFADTSIYLHPGWGPRALTPAEVSQYRRYRHRARDMYGALADRNPDFTTQVGAIRTKHHNEFMRAYLDLWVFQDAETALEELQPGLYEDFHRDYAYNLLQSCPKESILLTQGDNDTYSVLYLQAHKAIRRDVRVVPFGLMRSAPYAAAAYRSRFGSPGLDLDIPKEGLRKLEGRFIRVENNTTTAATSASDVVDQATDTSTWVSYYGVRYPQITTHFWRMKYRGRERDASSLLELPQIRWTYRGRTMNMAQLTLLNHLSREKGARPVCFPLGTPSQNRLYLDPYLLYHGMVEELFPGAEEQLQVHPDEEGTVAVERTAYDLLQSARWNFEGPLQAQERLQASNYLYAHLRSARAQWQTGDTVRCLKLLDQMFEVFNNETLPYNYYHLPFVKLYFKAGKKDRAAAIARVIMDNMEALRPNERYPLEVRRAFINELRALAESYDRIPLKKRIQRFEMNTGRGLPE